MPRNTKEIVEDLNDCLNENNRRHSLPAMTIPWDDFYELCQAERFKQQRLDEIAAMAKDTHGLIVGFGDRVIVVCLDRNFSPSKVPLRA